jgi:hypothetical protein
MLIQQLAKLLNQHCVTHSSFLAFVGTEEESLRLALVSVIRVLCVLVNDPAMVRRQVSKLAFDETLWRAMPPAVAPPKAGAS